MDPWYKVVTPRREVREGRSFSPDEFAIALEQVVAGTAPPDYSDPAQFFSRTCFTRALTEHSGMVLRRLSGRTENTAPVLTLITQFGGGKTHTLTSLYHLANAGPDASKLPGVSGLLSEADIAEAPAARVGVFVGNAWDPAEGRETPWIDLARQLAGDKGVAALGNAAQTTPPGTEALARVFAAAEAPVLLLFDEVLNFVNRHRSMAEPLSRLSPEPDRRHNRRVPGRRRHQPTAQPGRDDGVGPGVAGPYHQGRAPRRTRPHCQRRVRDQRGRATTPVRGPRRRARAPTGGQDLRRLVLRANGQASLRVDCRGHRYPDLPRAAIFSGAGSRRAIRSTLRRSLSSSGSGALSPSSSRRAGPWRCWRSGFPGPRESSSGRRGTSR